VKYIPYWFESSLNQNRDRNDPILLLAERWGYINNQIYRYSFNTDYLCLRFEDIFSGTNNIKNSTLNELREFIGCESISKKENIDFLKIRKNKSRIGLNDKYRIKQKHIDFLYNNYSNLFSLYDYHPSI
jgi:hypothetical protein